MTYAVRAVEWKQTHPDTAPRSKRSRNRMLMIDDEFLSGAPASRRSGVWLKRGSDTGSKWESSIQVCGRGAQVTDLEAILGQKTDATIN